MAGLAIVSAMLLSIFAGATNTEALHSADDEALEQLRDARQQMSRDVRQARRFTTIASNGFTIWIDEGWDEVVEPGELVSWWFDSSGDLHRSAGDASTVKASGLSPEHSSFSYDSAIASDVTAMALHLEVLVDDGLGGMRGLDTEITLRNMP
jgi:hypothetical protein